MIRREALLGALSLAAAGTLFWLAATEAAAQPPGSVALDEARSLHESGRVLLIDIREPQEHATGVADGALLVPMKQLASRWSSIPKERPIVLSATPKTARAPCSKRCARTAPPA
jgi:hypothetical protein